eukprot:g8898.t2
MSHAPVRRKSRQALAAASRKPAPHLIVLRVKRKRRDDPVESLLVSTEEGTGNEGNGMPGRKRRAPGGTGLIEETLADLSLDKTAAEHQHQLQQRQQQEQHENEIQPPKRLFYKRVRTTEPDGSGDRKKESRPATVAPPPTEGDCMKSGGGGRLDALLSSRRLDPLGELSLPPPLPAAALDFMEVRRVKARAVGHAQAHRASSEGSGGLGGQRTTSPSGGVASGTRAADFHVIDLQAVGTGDNEDMDTSGMGEGAAAGGAAAGGGASKKRTAAPVLSPGERQIDEAVFEAFQTGDFSSLRDLLTSCSPEAPAGVNYRRRLGDATTALMAAAFHGDLATVRYLLSLGAKASLVDAGGRTAAMFAGMRGHRECFAEVQRVADEEEKEQRARTIKRRDATAAAAGGGGGGEGAAGDDGHDFVYDLYYFEPSASKSPTEGAPASGGGGGTGIPTASGKAPDAGGGVPPVVRLSGIGPVDESAVGMMADVELEFEHDSDWSELGEGDDGEDTDSNSEGYYGNDYPEDEGDENDGGDAAPYIYGAGSGSSCASENGSSSDGGGFDSDSDIEQYSRRVVEMMPKEEEGFSGGGGFGAAGLAGGMPQTMAGEGEADNTFDAGLGLGSASMWELGHGTSHNHTSRAAMKLILPTALGATCLGVQLGSNHVDGFVSVVTAGSAARALQHQRAAWSLDVDRCCSRSGALVQHRRHARAATCRMMNTGFGQQGGDSGASGKAPAKKGKGKGKKAATKGSAAAEAGGAAAAGATQGTGQRQLFMQFTCNRCEGVSQYMINKNAYDDGIVICTCQSCGVRHLIADNLKKMDFPAFGDNIEQYMQSTGTPEEVTKGRAPNLTPDIVEKYNVAMGKDGVLTLSPKDGADAADGSSSSS